MNVSRKPRVIFFVYRLDDYSGAARQALKLATRLRDEATIRIVNIQASGVTGIVFMDGIPVEHAPSGRVRRFLYLLGVFWRGGFDIAHLHGYFFIPLLLAKLFGRRVLLKSTLLGDDDFESIRKKNWGSLRLMLARTVGLNNALSVDIFAINRRFLPADRITMIPNGVELAERGVKINAAPIFLFVGAIVRRKRPDLAIRYYIQHYASIPGAKLYLVGPHSIGLAEEDNDYFDSCKGSIRGYEDKVIFTGPVSFDEVQNYYKEAMALLFFSESEGMPNVVLEAMAHNCVPIMSASCGAAGEIIEHAKSGFIVRDNDEPVPLSAIEGLAAGDGPRNRIAAAFSMNKNAESNLAAYRQLIASRP